MEFFNRVDELAALEDNWTARGRQFYVLWGRRRVGKTELLSHFVEGKRSLYFEATDAARAGPAARSLTRAGARMG